MSRRYPSLLDGSGLHVGVVVSRFNAVVTDLLLEAALDSLHRHGVADDNVEIASVPGAFELPASRR